MFPDNRVTEVATAQDNARRGPLDIGVYGARGIPSTYSGYETFLNVLLPQLVERGHNVTIYCRKGKVSSGGDYEGVHRVYLPAPESKQLETFSHGFLAAVSARLAGHDVVFVVNVANAPFCLLARASGQRVVLNTDGQEWLRGKWGRAGRAYFRLSAHSARYAASALISDSEGMRKVYEGMFGAESTVIPYCWTELDHADAPEALTRLGVEPRKYFVIAGRLIPENNIHRVAESYIASGIPMPLLVLGTANYDSPVQRRLQELADSHNGVIVGGHVSDRGEYARIIREAAAYIHTHSVGGINPSIIEAMGCGARIAALKTVFNCEALGDAGTYFADFDEELPALLRSLPVEEPMASDRMRGLASERARSVFGLSAVAEAHERLFYEVARLPAWQTATVATRWLPSERALS